MKTVIFDFGNVIIKWDPYRALGGLFNSRDAMDTALKRIGFFDWNAEQDRGRSWQDGIAHARRHMPKHAHIFAAYANGLQAAHNQLIPGTSELIQRLHGIGVGLIGLTNASLETVEVVRQTAPVLDLMQDIVISAEVELIKPDPAIFELCLERAGLAPADALFVDDIADNCNAAHAIGLAAHHFTDAKNLETDLRDRGFF